jgi:tetratricopeptide (TPR) repeat protein
MKKILGLLAAIIVWYSGYGQSQSDVIKRANYLIANKRYESAFRLLRNFDSNNQMPDIVLLREDIALNFYVSTTEHQSFSFKDLRGNEDVTDYRSREGSYAGYNFPVNKILDNLVNSYPTNYKLYKGLGDYYAAVQSIYDDKWFISEDSLYQLIKKNFQIAIDHNVGDDFSYYEIGYLDISQKKYKEAIPYFLKSIAIYKGNPDAFFNLAYAYLYANDTLNALKSAKNAYRMYDDSTNKADAARMAAEIYVELKDTVNAIRFYRVSDEIDSNNYYTIQPLLNLYVKTNNKKSADELSSFFYLDPDNPTIYNDLTDIYYGTKKMDELINFYKSELDEFKDDNKATGNLYFYLAQIYLGIDKTVAAGYFIKAKEAFDKVYAPDNQVFKAISDGLQETDK